MEFYENDIDWNINTIVDETAKFDSEISNIEQSETCRNDEVEQTLQPASEKWSLYYRMTL